MEISNKLIPTIPDLLTEMESLQIYGGSNNDGKGDEKNILADCSDQNTYCGNANCVAQCGTRCDFEKP